MVWQSVVVVGAIVFALPPAAGTKPIRHGPRDGYYIGPTEQCSDTFSPYLCGHLETKLYRQSFSGFGFSAQPQNCTLNGGPLPAPPPPIIGNGASSRPNLLGRDGRYAFKIRRDGRFATKALAGRSNLGPVTASITGRFVGSHATGKLTYSGISYLGLVCSGGTARFRLGHNNGDAPYVPPGQHY